jgi:multiple sugar transport system ATP-binding protein
MVSVNLTGIRKSFGALTVLHGIDLGISDGEFVALVGPSGCGKSTLLRIISGLDMPSSGQIMIGDEDMTDVLPKDRDIAMVFQSYALYPHLSVAENMGFSLKMRRTPRSEIDRRVRATAGILNLGDYLERRPRELSGGQRQRVAMGRAIVRDPQVFLFDEPLSNLDAKLRVQMRTEIRALHQRLGATTIYVTHDQIEAMTMADRIVVMRDGRIEQVGTPLELYDRPANRFVAGFIGSPAMNFLPAWAEEGQILIGGQEVAARAPLPADIDPARVASVGLRPEHLLLRGHGRLEMKVSVEVVEPTGAETLVSARVDGTEILAALRDRVSPQIGKEITLAFEPCNLHVFDGDGTAIHSNAPELRSDAGLEGMEAGHASE